MRRRFPVLTCAGLLVGAVAASTNADVVIVQPNEPQSKDTFVYSFLPTFNFNAPQSGFNGILASGRSASAHDLRSLVQFDLTGVNLGVGEIATLSLFVADGSTVGFPVVNPSPNGAVTIDLFAVTSSWDAATVNWSSQPTYGAAPVDTKVLDGIGGYVTFDVTSLVQSWLSNPGSNFGFSLQQRDVVVNGGSVQAVYHSSASANRPFLYAGPVPEPALTTVVGAVATLLLRRRRA
jgi:hypothetical protein